MDTWGTYFLKSATGKIISAVLCASVGSMVNSAPVPSPKHHLRCLSCSNTQHTVQRNRELLISALETDGIIGNCTKPTHRWAQQLALPNFENHCLKERYTNRWSVDSVFQFRRCLCQRFLCVRREGLSS